MSSSLARRGQERTAILLVGDQQPAIVKQTADGAIQAFRANVVLSEAKGEVYGLTARVGEQWIKVPIPTAAGYMRINQVLGVVFHSPETQVTETGAVVPNPYIHRTKEDGIRYVRYRVVGVGRLPTGKLSMHDYTIYYDLHTYWAQDLMSKWTGKKSESVKEWGKLSPSEEVPPDGVERKRWKPLAIPGGAVLWVDLSHKDVIAAYTEHINRQKFAERNAITIAKRNIIKSMTGIVRLDDKCSVQVTGWVDSDRSIEEVAAAITKAESGTATIDGEVVDVQASYAAPTNDEIDEAIGGDLDEEMPPAEPDGPSMPGAVAPTPPQSTPTATRHAKTKADRPAQAGDPEIEAARKELGRLIRGLGSSKAIAVLGGVGIRSWDDVETCEDHGRLDRAIDILKRNGAV